MCPYGRMGQFSRLGTCDFVPLVGPVTRDDNRRSVAGRNRVARSPCSQLVLAGVVVFGLVGACAPGRNVDGAELSAVVERDGLPFTGAELPGQIVGDLASRRVILLGETHHLREHWELTVALLEELHSFGFRQLLVEQPQMADWWLDGYVGAGEFDPGWDPPPNWVRKFSGIRAFNESLPIEDRIHVRAIDANEAYYGGAESFRALLGGLVEMLEHEGPVEDYLAADHSTVENQRDALAELAEVLATDKSVLTSAWGPAWYAAIDEMVKVEQSSINIRSDRENDDDTAARTREEVIKLLADARIGASEHGTVINIGGHHAQKSALMGTDQEWLGDYLVNFSQATNGSVVVIGFTSAKTLLEPGAGGTPFDIVESSPEDELLRIMAEAWPEMNVFLPLSDPIFSKKRIGYNSEEIIYATPLYEVFDAVIQYGVAHRWPAD